MALADATVRVILDVSRFDRDLETKVAAAARRAGRKFESEFAKNAKPAGTRWAKDFSDQANQSMSSAGTRAGTQFGSAVRRAARPTGRLTGRDLGEQVRGGLLSTATLTGRQFGRGLLSGSITEAGSRLGQRLGRAIGDNLDVTGVGRRLRQRVEEDTKPHVLAAARTVATRFGSALGAAMGAVSISRFGFLVAGVGALVSEGVQLAAALAPGLQIIGLFPAAASVATASIIPLVVAFQGVGDALSAAASGDAEKLADALKNLTPAAASVVTEFAKLSPRLTELRKSVQEAFFSQLTGDLTRLGETLIGPVQRGMTSTAAAAGRMASGLLDVFSQTRNAGVIEQIFSSAGRAFDQMTAPMQRLTQGMLDWVQATLPAFDQLITSIGAGTTRFGDFLSKAAASGQAMVWINQAVTAISQLSRVALNAGRVVGTIFDAAKIAGGNYLLTLNDALIATRQFLAVGEGRAGLIGIFEGIHQVAQALAEPLRAAVVALGQMSPVIGSVAQALSSGLAAAIRGIGEGIANAGPGLTRFAQVVGAVLGDLGAILPSVGESLGRLLSAAAPLVSVFGVVARAGAAVLSVLSSLPGPVLTIVAAFLSLRALGVPTLFSQIQQRASGVGGAFGAVGNAASGVGSAFGRVADTYRANLASLTALRIENQVTANAMSSGIPQVSAFGAAVGGLSDRARAAGGAIGGGLLRGAQSLIGVLGGGVGIALTAASVLIGLWSDSQAKADQAVAEHAQRVRQLGSTLDKVTGSITAATRAQARQSFASSDLADSATRLGLSIDRVADASTGTEASQRHMLAQLRNSARGALEASGDWKEMETTASNLGITTDDLLNALLGNEDAMKRVNKATEGTDARWSAMAGTWGDAIPDQVALGTAINKTAGDLQKQADAIQKANAQMSPAQRLAEDLADAMGILADNSSSAADKARALDTALRLLNGGAITLADAQKAGADAVASGAEQIQQLADKYNIAGKTAAELGISTQELAARQAELGQNLFDSGGQINFASERARGLYEVTKNLRQATLDQAAAVVDNAQKTGGDMSQAYKQAADLVKASRDQIIQWATAAGFGATDAAKLADMMGLIPDNVKIALEMKNVPAILEQLGQVKGDIELLPDKKSLRLDSNARSMIPDLKDLGFLVEDIPGTKDFKIKPNTSEATAALQTFITQMITSKDPELKINANTTAAELSATQISDFIAQLPAVFKPGLDAAPVIADWQNLLLGPLNTPPGTPTVTPGVDGSKVTTWFDTYLQGLSPAGSPTVTPGFDPSQVEEGIGIIQGMTPPGTPTVTPGVNGAPAKGQVEGLLDGLIPQGEPTITPGVDTGPAHENLEGLGLPYGRPQITPSVYTGPADEKLDGLKAPIEGSPRVTPSAYTVPAQNQIQGLILQINNSYASGPIVGGNTAPAATALALLVGLINQSHGNVAVGADTAPGYGATNALVGYINRSSGGVGVTASTGLAYAQVGELVRYINSRTATVTVNTRQTGSIAAAQGGIFKYFAGGGIDSMRPMPANRAQIVPPKTMRVIGDRALGDEAFIPLVNSARSRSILQTAASKLGFDLAPRNAKAVTTRTTTVEAGAIVVQAPYSDPNLVARAVVNELTREAVP